MALHIVNSILLYILLLRMTASQWRSAMVAALFALHPLHVESVAWAAERKDVLSTMFAMLTILAYLRYVSRPCIGRFIPVFILLALGLMSKPMLVTIPFVLLLLDYWPLGRWALSPQNYQQPSTVANACGRTALWLVLEKLPLFVLAAASSVVTYIAQQGCMVMQSEVSLPMQLANVLVSYVAYIGKTVWPCRLIVFYPYVLVRPWWQPTLAAIFLLVVTGIAVWCWQKRPYLIVGWFWYLGTLVPVIGLVQVGRQSMADRYTYIPLIGLFILIVWGVADLWAERRFRRAVLGGLAGAAILACMILTAKQVSYWSDSRSLFEHALAITPENELAHNNLGIFLDITGRSQEAIEHYEQALHIRSDYFEPNVNLGIALAYEGQLKEAIKYNKKAISMKPNLPLVHYNQGIILTLAGLPREAIEEYQQAIRLKSDYAQAHNNMGSIYKSLYQYPQAMEHYNEALRIKTEFPEADINLGIILLRTGSTQEAIKHIEKGLRTKPNYPEAHTNLGMALVQTGRIEGGHRTLRGSGSVKPQFCRGLQRPRCGTNPSAPV